MAKLTKKNQTIVDAALADIEEWDSLPPTVRDDWDLTLAQSAISNAIKSSSAHYGWCIGIPTFFGIIIALCILATALDLYLDPLIIWIVLLAAGCTYLTNRKLEPAHERRLTEMYRAALERSPNH
jgi:hypothetical protein